MASYKDSGYSGCGECAESFYKENIWNESPGLLDTAQAPQHNRPVEIRFNLEVIVREGFLALTCLLGPSDEHIKSLQLLDTGKVVNLHKFKMAAVRSFNLQITYF